MIENRNDENTYPFYWLDELAAVTLNPEKNQDISSAELAAIRERLPNEFNQISDLLKNQAFCLYSGEHIKVVAGHYDQSIRLLQQQAQINLAQYPAGGELRETGQLLLDKLNELFQSIHHRYQNYLTEPPAADPEKNPLLKVLCRLSVDQIAIILKAADDIKLVVTRSFSQVLKSIVPFLSTERFANFSWKSARSSTYKMEMSDKAVAIETLEALISKIKEY
ncbi:hypothetical protein [Mucilaginibacter sp. AK015]|uniref:hypothetical protein n=1 Tax=Mucilaginibacter sp. AK015 TaxID=2723072 RepID=UPI0016227517|nr:hypothetical protein [Mucilaginibacter sp. AK015]MBB5396668.1 hypothetical protein [Mucilaginibacter sp. AK015]